MAQLSDDCFAFGGELMPIETALALIGERVTPIEAIEDVPLAAADGRVVARDVHAAVALPPFVNSAVDGWGVRFADLVADRVTELAASGRVAAGQSAEGLEVAGRAVRLFTGAPVPAGIDTIFMQEDATARDGVVVLPPGLKRGANLRFLGEDLAQGVVALPAGRRLRPQDLALAAAVGLVSLPVRRRLKVALFSTGDELCEPGEPLRPAAIYDSNRVLLASLLRRLGAEVSDLGILRDEPRQLAARLHAAAHGHDLILTSGGVSTGEEDHVRQAVEGIGSIVFWRLAIKPGRPVAMGVIEGTPLAGLPGNPVASFVTFVHLVRPLIDRLCGAAPIPAVAVPVRAAFRYRKRAGRREYVRVALRPGPDGALEAAKHPQEGAAILTSLTNTDGLVELPETCTSVSLGDTVGFFSYATLL
ncbi:MAG: molybdopterin molybdotransferase MoeA [Methylobacteriaceae bacterium]|nr:molybdopterin molybdotransferase MoeA [Methylobacteriaceae bacterium]